MGLGSHLKVATNTFHVILGALPTILYPETWRPIGGKFAQEPGSGTGQPEAARSLIGEENDSRHVYVVPTGQRQWEATKSEAEHSALPPAL